MNQKRPYPDEIKQRWESAIKPLNLSSAQQQYITQLVRYAQPPLTLDGYRQAATFYDHDCDPDSRVEAKLLTSVLSTAKDSNLGSHYPVFFALTTPRLLGSLNCPVSHVARLLLSDWFSEVEDSKTVSRGNFYKHILSVRHILRIVIDGGWHEKSPHETHSSYFLDAIRSEYLRSPRSRNEQHYNVFVALATQALSPGGIIRDTGNSGGGKGKGGTEKKTTDAWHSEHLKQCVTVPSPKRRRVSTAKHDTRLLSPHQLTDPELRAMGLQHKTPKTPQRSTSEEATEETTLQRSAASTLTRHDDRRFAQRWTSAAPTSSLATVSDLSRLPPSRIDEILSIPMDAISQVFVRLLLATGLPPRRLMSLTVRSHMNDISNPAQSETPHLISHGDETQLCYRLLNGANPDPQSPQNQWINLVLPTALAQPLLTHATDAKIQPPFRGVYASVNRQLKRYFHGKPGITPTINRITSASWLWRRPNARDDTAAGMFSGQFELSLSAPAAYRRISRAEIQKSFNSTLAHLGVAIDAYPQSATSTVSNAPSHMGSAVACNAQFFQQIFQHLLGNIRAASAPCSDWYAGKPFPCESLATLYQYVAAYELLGWQLSSGARPLGKRSQNRIGKYLQWVQDKGSSQGTESRVIPVAADTRKGITALQRWTRSLISVLSQQGIVLSDQRSGVRDTPAWLTTTHQGKRFLLRDMTWSDMTSLSLPALSTRPNNVTRHSLTSWLRLHLPDAQLDALLGHARHGRNLASPQGATALGQQTLLRTELARWLKKSGYQPIHWERLPWNI